MTLPRVSVEVSRTDDGWRVLVRHDAQALGECTMRRIVAGGIELPAAPADRLPPADAPHHVYCAGQEQPITDLLDRLARNKTKSADVVAYGRWLFHCLLEPIWAAVAALPAVRDARGVELALCWPVADGALRDLLWEAMHDGGSPLAGHPRLLVAITRIVPCDVARPPLISRSPRVLLAAGSGLAEEVIRPGAMFMGLLRSAEAEGLCLPRVADDVTAGELDSLCREFDPDFVQLVAHGRMVPPEDGVAAHPVVHLGVDKAGGGVVEAGRLVPALTAGGSVTGIVLCVCRSGSGFGRTGALPLALELVTGGVPVVVAMTGDVNELACRLYTRRMMASVHAGEPLVEAAARGRRAALVGTEQPGDFIDWAMPALFLAASVDPAEPLVDAAAARRLSGVAAQLELIEKPVFVGRMRELDVLRDMIPAPRAPAGRWRVGCVIFRGRASIKDQGGTRLLRELGNRLLHQGHIPLLLGPYAAPPNTLRAVTADILAQMAFFAETVGLPPPDPRLLTREGLGRPPDGEVTEIEILQADLNLRIEQFRGRDERLPPGAMRPLLGADLRALATAAQLLGPPFGPHTTTVILADEIHHWAGALADLLAMVKASGLGTPDAVVPFIATGSEQEDEGQELRAFTEANSGNPQFRIFELARMPPGEASVGFQWVLMHPWGDHRHVYTADRNTDAESMALALDALKGLPTAVRANLWMLAQGLSAFRNLIVHPNDDEEYQKYADHYR